MGLLIFDVIVRYSLGHWLLVRSDGGEHAGVALGSLWLWVRCRLNLRLIRVWLPTWQT